jgi:hypothetical protein
VCRSLPRCSCANAGLLLKLFSRCLVFIVISYVSNANGPAACHHQAVAGFFDPSFEGEKQKWQCHALVVILFTAANSINCCEILMKSASKASGEGAANFGTISEPATSYRVFEQVMFRYGLTKKGKPHESDQRQH